MKKVAKTFLEFSRQRVLVVISSVLCEKGPILSYLFDKNFDLCSPADFTPLCSIEYSTYFRSEIVKNDNFLKKG